MRKLILGLPLAAAVALVALVFLAGRQAHARWAFRDHTTAVNPVSVCRDGMYLGIGDKTVSGPIEVTAVLEAGGDEVFSRVYDDLPANTDENVDLAFSDYFLESWDEEDRPLTPGDVVIFPGGMMRNPTATVENCTILQTAPAVSGFSYQGTLHDGQEPANGLYDLRFRLWDAATGGSQQGAALTLDDVSVNEGVFNVRLDFGPTAFSAGRARWLEMNVRPAGSGQGYTTLSPRQELLAAPYAHSLIAGAAIVGHSTQEPALTVENRLGAALQVGGGFQGLVVDYADHEGVRVDSAGYDAFSVGKATYGLRVEEVMTNGVDIQVAGVTGLRIGSAGTDGVSIQSAGRDGVHITAARRYGIYANTVVTEGYGGYFNNNTDNPIGPDVVLGGSVTNDEGNLWSNPSQPGSDIYLRSNDEIWVHLDRNNDENAEFRVLNGTSAAVFTVDENGNTSATGTKSAVVETAPEAYHRLYAMESTEVVFEDFGSGQVVDGMATVEIDPLFAQTVNLKMDYQVFLTAVDGWAPLYVANKTPTSFEVRDAEGAANVAFDYRIVAHRAGYGDVRLEPVAVPETLSATPATEVDD